MSLALKMTGLELMDDNKKILVEKIKTIIIELIHYNDEQIKINLSSDILIIKKQIYKFFVCI